jgi:hypothetical protein
MSFTENDRNVRDRFANVFRGPSGSGSIDGTYRGAVAGALRRDFGRDPAAVKRVARLLDANERAVRNWYEGKNGPSGENLVRLMAHSPATVEAVLWLSGLSELLSVKLVADAREQARKLLETIEGLVS